MALVKGKGLFEENSKIGGIQTRNSVPSSNHQERRTAAINQLV
jgi:hypothetical protein